MAITIIGKHKPQLFQITCTDKSCRNIIQFTRDDASMVNRSSMGRVFDTVLGISCPDCAQILPLEDAKEIPED